MCRMMGVQSNNLIKADWILPFERLAIDGKIRSDMNEPGHHDGWGMVSYFRNKFPEYIEREPHSVTQDQEHFKNGSKLIERSKCRMALIHFRKISVGKPMISNTHPFLYKEWAFCHNGTIFDSEKIPLLNLKPSGTTDSERFFLYIMEKLDKIGQDFKLRSVEMKKTIDEIMSKFEHTSLTFLLTNGETIYAYRECDPKYQDYYTLYTTQTDGGSIVSSETFPQLSKQWTAMGNDSLVVIGKNN